MKLFVVAIIVTTLTALNAAAETVVCENSAAADKSMISHIELKPIDSFGMETMLDASAWNDFHQTSVDVVRRSQKSGVIFYRDFQHSGSFILTLKPGVGGDYQGSLAIYAEKYSGFVCTITGKPLASETNPIAGCEKDKKKLNRSLIEAAQTGEPSDIEDILNCGADANFKDSHSCTPLLYVTDLSCGQSSSGGTGGDPSLPGGNSPISNSRDGLALQDLINRLFDGGAQVDLKDPSTGRTPLMNVVRYGQNEVIGSFLDMEADINAQDRWGNTSVMYAAANGDELSLWSLLDASPDLNLKNKKGKTAYDVAKENGHNKLLPSLTPAKVTITIEGKSDGTCSPLQINLKKDEPTAIVLHATGKMFLLRSSGIGISELMAEIGGSSRIVISASFIGKFPFTCGPHGGGSQSSGTFIVQ